MAHQNFNPKDGLIMCFLYHKVNAKPLPDHVTSNILDCDLFGQKNPWEIWEGFGGAGAGDDGKEHLYLFSTVRMVGSSRSCAIGSGLWKLAEDIGTTSVVLIKGRCAGFKRFLRFEGSGTGHDRAWTMQEYSLHSSLFSHPSATKYVVCKLMKNDEGKYIPNPASLETRVMQKATGRRTKQAVDATVSDIQETPRKREKGQLQGENNRNKRTKVVMVDEVSAIRNLINKEARIMQKEEDMELISNPFARAMLLERIDFKYFGTALLNRVVSKKK